MIGREIGHFFVGLMFLTRLPVPKGLRHVEGRLARSARYFPLIGVLVGVCAGVVFYGASMVLSPILAAGLAIVAALLITGALHEDGLADCADGLGAGGPRARMLEIMRDNRIGTYGAIALITSCGLRAFALFEMTPLAGLQALIIAHAVSRAMIPLVLVSGSYARSRGLASSVAEGATRYEAALSTLIALAVAMIAGPVVGLTVFAVSVITGGVMLAVLVRRLGGYTGDGLGAIQQLSEISILILLAGIWA